MNRKLIVTLLRKDIQELDMITEGFMEMEVYPKAIIGLAQRKTEDIQSYIRQLSELKQESEFVENEVSIHEPAGIVLEKHDFEQPVEEPEKEELIQPVAETIEITPETEIVEITETVVEVEEETVETEIDVKSESVEITEMTTTSLTDTKIISEETKKTIIGEKIVTPTISRNELHSKIDNSLSSTIANKRISDIKQAISIGERFRFQRELFKGNGEDMNKTLTYINQLATLEEVQSFLQSKYGWESENETADDFLQIVKRRFV